MNTCIQQLKGSLDLLAVVSQDVVLRPHSSTRGGEYVGPCPFCRAGKDRFHVWPEAGRFWCRVCGGKGDVLDYLAAREGLDTSTREGWRRVMQVAAPYATMPPRPALPPPARPRPTSPALEWQTAARSVITLAVDALWAPGGSLALDWLLARGLAKGTLRRWQIGLVPDTSTGWRTIAGLQVPCGILIPWQADGKVWQLKVRRRNGPTKYMQVKGSDSGLYLADSLAGHRVAVFAEGELDALVLWQEAGDLVGVASLGSASTPTDLLTWGHYLRPLVHILIAYDQDQAGRQGAQKLADTTHRAHILSLPSFSGGKDVTDYLRAGGRVREWLLEEARRLGIALAPSTPRPSRPAETTSTGTVLSPSGAHDA